MNIYLHAYRDDIERLLIPPAATETHNAITSSFSLIHTNRTSDRRQERKDNEVLPVTECRFL